ncbi:MAG: MBOAT family O-acyltransferase, partial [Cyanobacteria bacterium P01_H01_bin.15]
TAAVGGVTLTHFEAWVGAISFALQVYFDFSGYTDMAIGAARMFGVKLPINFNSPFKSITISQFWRTWHMTLTRFMREYVYFPLSGWLQNLTLEEETGPRTPGDINLVTTTTTVIVMLLIGIWHGAGWSFLIWGAINGIYLIGYQQWREFRRRLGHDLRKTTWWSQLLGWFLTFVMWCSALVWARSDSVFTALKMWQGMYFGGWTWPDLAAEQLWSDVLLPHVGLKLSGVLFWIPVLLAIAVLTPNSQQWLEKYQSALDHYVLKTPKNLYQKFWLRWRWQINPYWAVIVAVVSTMAIIAVGNEKEFIYFQF